MSVIRSVVYGVVGPCKTGSLDVYTQAITPAKHAAQTAVISLLFSSDKDGPALVAG